MLILILIVLVALSFYFSHKSNQKAIENYTKHGIPYLPTNWSRTFKVLSGSLDPVHMSAEIYKDAASTNAPIVAMADMSGKNALYIRDLDLLKQILVKDFDHFVNLPEVTSNKSSKYYTKMLINMQNDQWRGIRAKLSPAFTTGKMRRMFKIFLNSSKSLDKYVKENLEGKSGDLDFCEFLFKYSMDVIAKSAFGVVESEIWNLKPGEHSAFEQFGKRYGFIVTGKTILKYLVMSVAPRVADFLELDIFDHEAQTYFANVVKTVMKQRRESGQRHEDFLQLMMDAQQGLLKNDDGEESDEKLDSGAADKVRFTDDDVIANALLFFIAGFDTTQTVLIFTLYCLALEPEVQERVFEEINGLVEKNGGELTFDAIGEMNYLQMVMNETMRMYPAFALGLRACTKDYPVPGSSYVIEKGSTVMVPMYGIHNDSRFYPNPEKFDPERFSPENKQQRHPFAFIPFGHGPRSCIGNRFAMIKVKTVIAQLVLGYKFSPCSKTEIPIQFDNKWAAKPKNGMWLNVALRN